MKTPAVSLPPNSFVVAVFVVAFVVAVDVKGETANKEKYYNPKTEI